MDDRVASEFLSLAASLFAIASMSCEGANSQRAFAGYTKIDDMEAREENGRIAWLPPGWPEGFNGFWASSTDCTQQGRIIPAPYFANPVGQSGWSYDEVPKPHPTMPQVTSQSAARLRTRADQQLQGVWGANIGFDFAQAPGADSGTLWHPATDADAGSSTDAETCRQGSSRDFNGAEVNLEAYSGLTFWAMAWAGGRQSVRVQINDWQTDPRGDQCTSSQSTDESLCYDSFGKSFMLTDTFTQYSLDFSELRQEGWGAHAGPFDQTRVYSLNFLVPLPGCTGKRSNANCAGDPPPISFDVWIDDLYFINKPAQ